MREKITTRRVNGCKLNVVENRNINHVDVEISYDIPINIERRFVGVPHLFEHMAFNDIISSAKSSTEVMSLASSLNIDLNAYTSSSKIAFTATLKSFILLDKRDPAYSSLKRFDMSTEAMKFLKKYIEGVVAKHSFTQTELDAEIGIILGERMSSNSAIELLEDKLARAVSGVDILGSEQDIKEFDLDTLHEFASILPKPSISIKYNPDIDEFSDIEYYCERALNKVESNYAIPVNKIDRVPSISSKIYDGELDIRYYDDGKVINGIAFTYPVYKDHKIENVEKDIVKGIAARMLFSPFLDGSIGNVLREVKNLTYSIPAVGLIAGDTSVGTFANIAHINDAYNFNKVEDLREFCKLLEDIVNNLRTPTETEFITALSENAVTFSNYISTMSTGAQLGTYSNLLNQGYSPAAIEVFRTLPFEFNYRMFKEIFSDLKEFLTFVIL